MARGRGQGTPCEIKDGGRFMSRSGMMVQEELA